MVVTLDVDDLLSGKLCRCSRAACKENFFKLYEIIQALYSYKESTVTVLW